MFLFHTQMKILNNSQLVSVVNTQRWMFYLEYHKPSNSYLKQFASKQVCMSYIRSSFAQRWIQVEIKTKDTWTIWN